MSDRLARSFVREEEGGAVSASATLPLLRFRVFAETSPTKSVKQNRRVFWRQRAPKAYSSNGAATSRGRETEPRRPRGRKTEPRRPGDAKRTEDATPVCVRSPISFPRGEGAVMRRHCRHRLRWCREAPTSAPVSHAGAQPRIPFACLRTKNDPERQRASAATRANAGREERRKTRDAVLRARSHAGAHSLNLMTHPRQRGLRGEA